MPNRSQNASQFCGARNRLHINKYSAADHRKIGGRKIRLLMPNEIAEFKKNIQRIIDGDQLMPKPIGLGIE